MIPTVVQILIAIATILGSGVVSAIVSNHFTVTRAEREFKRKKLEELFLAVHKYGISLLSQNIVWPRVMKGELTYDEANTLNLKNADHAIGHFEIAEMLVNIYFPELRSNFDEIITVRDGINAQRKLFTKSYIEQEPTESYIKPFNEALTLLAKVHENFKKRLIQVSNEIK